MFLFNLKLLHYATQNYCFSFKYPLYYSMRVVRGGNVDSVNLTIMTIMII